MIPDYEENVDFELIPTVRVAAGVSEGEKAPDNEWSWYVRFLTGDFVETVIEYGTLTEDEENHQLKFDFSIVSTPDKELTVENQELQLFAADVLRSLIIKASQAQVEQEEEIEVDE